MAYEFDTPIGRLNQRKLYKWLFLLLQKHHERLGLKVLAWSGPDGIGTHRISLYFDVGSEPIAVSEVPVLGMHLYQSSISVRHEVSGDVQYPPKNQAKVELRTQDTLPWLESKLAVIEKSQKQQVFPLPQASSAWWPAAAQRYLRSWNVLGLLLKAIPEFVALETLGASAVHAEESQLAQSWATAFYPEVSRTDILHFRDSQSGDPIFWLHSGRVCKASGQSLDLNVLRQKGLKPEAMAAAVLEFVPHLRGLW